MSADEEDAKLDKTIAERMATEEGVVVSRFVLVAEVMEVESGDREIIIDNAEGMMPWDVTALLDWAIDAIKIEDEEEEA